MGNKFTYYLQLRIGFNSLNSEMRDPQTHGWTNGRTDQRTDRQSLLKSCLFATKKPPYGPTDGQTDRLTDGWTLDRQSLLLICMDAS